VAGSGRGEHLLRGRVRRGDHSPAAAGHAARERDQRRLVRESWASVQHLQISQMRALETGRVMLRATNTGVTAAVDHRGRVLARLPEFRPTFSPRPSRGAKARPPSSSPGTFLPVLLATALLALACAARAGPESVTGSRPKASRIRAFVFPCRGCPRYARHPMLTSRSHPHAPETTGPQAMRAAPAHRHGGRRRHLAHRDVLRALGPEPWRGRLRAASRAARRMPLRRQPESASSITTTSTRWC